MLQKMTPDGLIELTPEEEAEILALRASVAANAAANSYKYARANNYPTIPDQLDLLWHAMNDGHLAHTNGFYDALKAIKDAHPKSVQG